LESLRRNARKGINRNTVSQERVNEEVAHLLISWFTAEESIAKEIL